MVPSMIDTCIKSVGQRVKCGGTWDFFPLPLPVVEMCAKTTFWALKTVLKRKSFYTLFLPF